MAGVTGVADRYAAALYELADERGALDAVDKDLGVLDGMLATSADLRKVIASPVLAREDQRRVLLALADKAGFSELTRNCLGTMAKGRRAFALPGVIRGFKARLATARGEMTAHVATAAPLSEAQSAALGDALKSVTGRDVTVQATVDPALLGGMVVRLGSRMVDSSLRTKLKRLQLAMKGVG